MLDDRHVHTQRKPARRGMALLLVMIGMIVCTILTAGFLSSQGTSIGIARNERDASKCRGIAQSGVDMCYWLIRNKSDWRESMTPGTWLNGAAIGDGTVTVSVSDGDNTGSFSDDPTQSAVVTSTGAYDNRSFALTATIRPTGGGTVFANGNFIQGALQLGNNSTGAVIDSYNSSVSFYNPLTPGSNAVFGSNSLANNALTISSPSTFRGTYIAAPLADLSKVIALTGGAAAPTAISTATESRNPGTVVFPNTTGLTYRGNPLTRNNQVSLPVAAAGKFDAINLTNSDISLNASGIYYITGNVTINNGFSSKLSVADGVTALLVVDGNVTIQKTINLNTSGQLAIYANGSITITSANVNATGSTARLIIYGSSTCNAMTIQGSSFISGAIYAPQAAITMNKSSLSSPTLYGAVVAHDLTMKDGSAIHFDEALKSLYLSNITGGSASPGTADYRMVVNGGPGIGH